MWHLLITIGGQALVVVGILGLSARVARPHINKWFTDNLIKPLSDARADVAEVKVATTVNGHSQDRPTLPDRMSDVHDDVKVLSEQFGAHLIAADKDRADMAKLTKRVGTLERRRTPSKS